MMRAINVTLILVLCCFPVSADEGIPRAEVISVLEQYESLNEAFLASVGTASESQRRTAAEEFARGPFGRALDSAVGTVCAEKDAQVLRTLFRVTLATSNSASEAPAWALGRIFVCQASLVEQEFRTFPEPQKSALYPLLRFGFGNVVDGHIDASVARLSGQLEALAPKAGK